VFARGPDGALGCVSQVGPDGNWTSWEELGPVISGDPLVFQNADGRLEVFAAGPDGLLGHVWQLEPRGNSGWWDWDPVGPALSAELDMARNADGRHEVFAAGPDGLLGHVWQHHHLGYSGWAGWDSFGVAISSAPAVVQNAGGRLEVFAAGPDGLLGHVWQLGPNGYGGWAAWDGFGVAISGVPAIVQNADGRLEVFAAGPDGLLGHVWQLEPNGHGGWSGWEVIGPDVRGRRLAVCLTTNPVSVPAEVRRGRGATPRRRTIRADVCVIGAGPAGVTVCDGLVRAGANVLLAESGSLEEDPAAQDLNNGLASGPILRGYWRYLRNGRRRGVQGSASVWGRGWCMPFRALDYEHRPWVVYSDWPLSAADLEPYEAMAAATFGFEPFEPPRPEGELVRVSYHYPPDPQVFRGMFTNLLAEPRCQAELGATAVELVVRDGRIESVRFALSDGGELRVAADKVVLATGAIENARLLLLHERTLPTSDMLGRCFMEHPHVLAGTVTLPASTPLRDCTEDGPERDVLALDDETQYRERLLNATVQLRRRTQQNGPEGSLNCDLYVRAEQAPNPESRVTLGDRLDRLGFPWPVLDWQLLGRDWASLFRTVALVESALEERHDAVVTRWIRAETPWPGAPASPPESPNATWGFHHLGTTRMATGPDEGVVDRNCLVHGTDNLYVAGSSVFPTGSCANPTFMIVAMAHRLVDHLSRSQPREDRGRAKLVT
jgi:choline dehydrogenase-like flavoprotein